MGHGTAMYQNIVQKVINNISVKHICGLLLYFSPSQFQFQCNLTIIPKTIKLNCFLKVAAVDNSILDTQSGSCLDKLGRHSLGSPFSFMDEYYSLKLLRKHISLKILRKHILHSLERFVFQLYQSTIDAARRRHLELE